MKKDLWKISYRMVLLMVPFFVLLPLFLANCQFFYMDGEYAMYRAQRDFVDTSLPKEEEPRVLILGDSRAKAALMPEKLSDDTYNLALGGTTAIEGYYTVQDYLKTHEKPQTIIFLYAPFHYMKVDMLWNRSIYFHYLKKDQALSVFETAKEYQDTDEILTENYLTDFYCYEYYMPNKYGGALKNSAFFFRKKINDEKYAQMFETRGHSFFGLDEENGGINYEAKQTDFSSNDVITHYMDEMLDYCEKEGIQVIVEATPVNETSYGIFSESFKAHFREYMNGMQEKHPNVQIYTDFYVYPNTMFGDADHLNPNGTTEFSKFMKEKYKGVFTK